MTGQVSPWPRDDELAGAPLLVGLGGPDGEDQPVGTFFEVLDVDGHTLGAPEGTGDPDEHQRPVPHGQAIGGQLRYQPAYLVDGGRGGFSASDKNAIIVNSGKREPQQPLQPAFSAPT